MLDTVTIYSDDLIERWNKDTTVNLLCVRYLQTQVRCRRIAHLLLIGGHLLHCTDDLQHLLIPASQFSFP